MLEDTDEDGFICLTLPPISGHFSVEGLWDPNVQLTGEAHRNNDEKPLERKKPFERAFRWPQDCSSD